MEIQGLVAFITGASRGIGRAIAKALAKEGCHVALAARNAELLEETARLCRSYGVEVLTFPFEITDTHALQQAIESCVHQLGSLNILINNAGIHVNGSVRDASLEQWDHLLDVNLKSVIHATHYALPYLEQSSQGSLIYISSTAGKVNFPEESIYCASKHGLMSFVGSIFEEVRQKNIKVCAICPGFVNTEMAQGRHLDPMKMIQPEDVAHTVVFVLKFPQTGCPTEITIRPQHSPYL